MFLVHSQGLKKDGTHPVFLYGYGGFEASIQPYYKWGDLLLSERHNPAWSCCSLFHAGGANRRVTDWGARQWADCRLLQCLKVLSGINRKMVYLWVWLLCARWGFLFSDAFGFHRHTYFDSLDMNSAVFTKLTGALIVFRYLSPVLLTCCLWDTLEGSWQWPTSEGAESTVSPGTKVRPGTT